MAVISLNLLVQKIKVNINIIFISNHICIQLKSNGGRILANCACDHPKARYQGCIYQWHCPWYDTNTILGYIIGTDDGITLGFLMVILSTYRCLRCITTAYHKWRQVSYDRYEMSIMIKSKQDVQTLVSIKYRTTRLN